VLWDKNLGPATENTIKYGQNRFVKPLNNQYTSCKCDQANTKHRNIPTSTHPRKRGRIFSPFPTVTIVQLQALYNLLLASHGKRNSICRQYCGLASKWTRFPHTHLKYIARRYYWLYYHVQSTCPCHQTAAVSISGPPHGHLRCRIPWANPQQSIGAGKITPLEKPTAQCLPSIWCRDIRFS